ncbi:hypothetical protein BKA70DRAFT_1408859 [Coprinopsis sp. MPI-PUGE-AT-0042]|nr:hypothetical protein BKA70DRAFT_1408859 [Coprinopsis sp. MPI-PUGE-AT-0042]
MPELDRTPASRPKTPGATFLHSRRKDHEYRVLKASPTSNRCIFKNMEKDRSVQLCHVLPRAKANNDRFMETLEGRWAMEYWSLNLDSKSNAFFAGAHFHQLFDNGSLILLPSIEDLERLTEKFPDVGIPNYQDDEVFEYQIVPLTMTTKVVHRLTSPDAPLVKKNYETHVRPHFAVMHIGLRLDARPTLRNGLRERVSDQICELIDTIYTQYTLTETRKDKSRFRNYVPAEDDKYDDGHPEGDDGDDPKDKDYPERSGTSTRTMKTTYTLNWRKPGFIEPRTADDEIEDHLSKKSHVTTTRQVLIIDPLMGHKY